MKKSFQSEGQVIPKKVVQLLKNGKIANLPLKKGSGKFVPKTPSRWANAAATTSSDNATITFFDDTRALQTVTDQSNLKLQVIKLNPDGTITQSSVYTYGQGQRIYAFKRSDTEIMLVVRLGSFIVQLIFVSIDASDNLMFETVPVLTSTTAMGNNDYNVDITTVDESGDTFVIGTMFSVAPYNAILIPFKVTGRTVQVGSVFVFDAQYQSNRHISVCSWEPGKIALLYAANVSTNPPLLSTFSIDSNLQISLLYRDVYPNYEITASEALDVPQMKKISKGRIALQYKSSSIALTIRVLEFTKAGVPLYSQKKTQITGGKSTTSYFALVANGLDVGFSFGRMAVVSSDPLYNRSIIYPWAVDGDEVIAGDYLIYEDGVQILTQVDKPQIAFNKSGNRFVISHFTADSLHIWMHPFEVQEPQQFGKVLGVAESSNTVTLSGAVGGLEGLVPGEEYSYDVNGDLVSKSQYTQNGVIGRAISPSTLLLYDYLLK